MIDVCIVSPLYDGRAHDDHSDSIRRAIDHLRRKGLKVARRTVRGCPVLPRARNMCVAVARQLGAHQVLFVDGDIGFEPQEAEKILEHPEPIVGAAPQGQLRSWREETPRLVWAPHASGAHLKANGLIPCRGLATGFLKVRACVFERLVASGAARRYIAKDFDVAAWPFLAEYFGYAMVPVDLDIDPPLAAQVRAAREAGLDLPPDAELLFDQGEDYYFCDRAAEAGYESFLDPDIAVRHWEGRVVHDFSYREALALRNAARQAQEEKTSGTE